MDYFSFHQELSLLCFYVEMVDQEQELQETCTMDPIHLIFRKSITYLLELSEKRISVFSVVSKATEATFLTIDAFWMP